MRPESRLQQFYPMYHVVVGDVFGKDNVMAVSAKLGDVETRRDENVDTVTCFKPR